MKKKEGIMASIFDKIALSFDIDWAPDFIIDFTAKILIDHNIKASWFITHKSEAIERLSDFPELFDLGVHPNFLENSTQGSNFSEIMDFIMKIVPDALTVRTHGMYYSAEISRIFAEEYGLKYDSSIYLKEMSYIQPQLIYYKDSSLLRMPYFWEESGEMMNPIPSFNIENRFNDAGLKIFDFHPIHVFLNSRSMENYNCLKKAYNISTCQMKDVQNFINKRIGSKSLLMDLINKRGGEIENIENIGRIWVS